MRLGFTRSARSHVPCDQRMNLLSAIAFLFSLLNLRVLAQSLSSDHTLTTQSVASDSILTSFELYDSISSQKPYIYRSRGQVCIYTNGTSQITYDASTVSEYDFMKRIKESDFIYRVGTKEAMGFALKRKVNTMTRYIEELVCHVSSGNLVWYVEYHLLPYAALSQKDGEGATRIRVEWSPEEGPKPIFNNPVPLTATGQEQEIVPEKSFLQKVIFDDGSYWMMADTV